MKDIYMRLAKHLEDLIMGYPYNPALIDLLKGNRWKLSAHRRLRHAAICRNPP
jgi:hypothetical protein